MRIVCMVLATVCILLGVGVRSAEACRGCKPPRMKDLAGKAERVIAGTVRSSAGERSVIEVTTQWKGAPTATVEKTGCWQLFEKVGAKVIVVTMPAGFRSKWVSECLGVYADTPSRRAALTSQLGPPTTP